MSLEELIERLPPGSVSTHPGELASRSRDWWALSMLRELRGDVLVKPSAVVFPSGTEEVATVLAWASETGTAVVPRGMGSSVVGGAEAVKRGIVLDLTRMGEILAIDGISLTASVQAGIRGDRLEQALGEQGLTTGHYPQSLAISTVGGWIAATSAGQASAGYGGIEDLLLGLTAVLADGTVVRVPPHPRSAAGPALRHLFVGSEGTYGVITEATLALSRVPVERVWDAFGVNRFEAGADVVRQLTQRRAGALVVRLYDEPDAALAFGRMGHPGGPVLLVGWDSGAPGTEERRAWARQTAFGVGATALGGSYGEHWWEHRNDAVDTYRRVMGAERLLGDGTIVDTMEVAGPWSGLPALYAAVGDALRATAEAVGCHISHPYRSGASLYYTFLLRGSGDIGAEELYLRTWAAAIEACHAAGGTMTHHHGVGVLKAPFMEEEVGGGSLEVLRRVKAALDPGGILNPGKLLP